MKRHEFILDSDVVTYIERLNYEYETLKDTISYIVNHFSTDEKFMQSRLFKKYQENQINAKINLDRGMQEVYEKYIPDKYKEHRIGWNIDFRRKLLVVTLYCDCEVC